MESITAVKGFKDILPQETGKWHYVEGVAREIFTAFGFREIRVPILEKTDLFRRSIGEGTDIVEKEMYTFSDRGDEYVTLRPEATASIVRSYLEHTMYAVDTIAKLFTIGPMFRRERPQKGRYRQFHQINVELIGLDDPRTDAEMIIMLIQFLERVQLSQLKLQINSLGCAACRPPFKKALTDYLKGKEEGLCDDCRRRVDTNPLRVFDCKVAGCAELIDGAPRLITFLCKVCEDHFMKVRDALDTFAIPYEINTKMVRGLDYYTKTTFEVITEPWGAQNAVVGGGRYDGLVKALGGPDVPGIGFAIGCERLISLSPLKDSDFLKHPDLFIAALGDEAQTLAYTMSNRLRIRGVQTEVDYAGKSLKSQMKRADKLRCRYTLILGEQEITANKAQLRDMHDATQQSVDLDSLEDIIIQIVKGK